MIIVEPYRGWPVTEQTVEVVERKGRGHPDYICDAVMESISVALSREYKKAFGAILHHNIDKGLLAAGRTKKSFGGGSVTKPMELTIGDRASAGIRGKRIDVKGIAVSAAKKWLRKNLRFVDPEKDVKYRVVLAPGSEELTDIFLRQGDRQGEIRSANDTSALVGYYPLSPTEEAVLALERHLNSEGFKEKYPETGEDVKVMGLRNGSELDLTVAMPLIAGAVASEGQYFKRKAEVRKAMERFLARENRENRGNRGNRGKRFKSVRVDYNTLDQEGRGLGGVYLSLLGTSAEDADSGQVGRGNRVNGLIAMNRPMSTEAAAGKNPVSHVGKIYNVLAPLIAERICREAGGVREAHVLLLSRIGQPVDRPLMASAQVLPERGARMVEIRKRAGRIIERELAGIAAFCGDLAEGKYPIC